MPSGELSALAASRVADSSRHSVCPARKICNGHSDRPCAGSICRLQCAVPYRLAAHHSLTSAKLLLAVLVLNAPKLILQARAASAKAKGEKVNKARKERTKEAKEVSASFSRLM